MNAKETYKKNYGEVRKSASLRWTIDNGYSQEYEYKAMQSYRAATIKNPMTFKTFLDCLEAAQNGLAYATRKYWFFIVNGDELQFTKEECSRFARYFSEGFILNWSQYNHINKHGGCYLNERLLENEELFPLRVKLYAYNRFIIGQTHCATKAGWVCHQNEAIADARFERDIPSQADYDTEQSDINAEISMQRYGV